MSGLEEVAVSWPITRDAQENGGKGGEVKEMGFLGPLPMLILVLDAV